MTHEEAKKLIKIALAQWPSIKSDTDLVEAYTMGLESLSYSEAREAVAKLLSEPTREWPPTTNNIMAAVLEARKARQRLTDERQKQKLRALERNSTPEEDEKTRRIIEKTWQENPELSMYVHGIYTSEQYRAGHKSNRGMGSFTKVVPVSEEKKEPEFSFDDVAFCDE